MPSPSLLDVRPRAGDTSLVAVPKEDRLMGQDMLEIERKVALDHHRLADRRIPGEPELRRAVA